MSAGVAFFSNPSNIKDGGGWLSLSGDRAKRFNGFADLDAGHIWITNIGMVDFKDIGLSKSAHLRNANFLRLTLASIASDCGYSADADIPVVVETLSGLFSRTVDIAKSAMPGIYFKDSLADSIYAFYNINDADEDPAIAHQEAFQAAYQENSQVAGNPYMPSSEIARLSVNRVDFAEEVLSYAHPSGGWRGELTGMSIDEFINLPQPALANVSVDLRAADKPELLAFGYQNSGTAVIREWITQPEASMLMSAGAKVKFGNILRGSSINDGLELPSVLTENSLIRSSYSAGIVAENFLQAMTSKRYVHGPKNRRTKHIFPARAVYLRSIERMMSYGLAKQMSERNHVVLSYGMGMVTIRVTEDLFAEAIKDAADLGFSIASSKFKL